MRRSWKQGNKPYCCDVHGCGKTFFHYPSLFRHRKEKHRLIGSKIPPEIRVVRPAVHPVNDDSLPNLGQLDDIEELAAPRREQADEQEEEDDDDDEEEEQQKTVEKD